MITEADTCRKYILPRLINAGWDNLVVPVPPLSKQRRIVADLDALQAKVDTLKEFHAKTTNEIGALLPSVLDKASKGELSHG